MTPERIIAWCLAIAVVACLCVLLLHLAGQV
jgi:hypothetical protein